MPNNHIHNRLAALAPGINARQPELTARLDSRGGILELGVRVNSFREGVLPPAHGTISERPVALIDGARAFADALAAHPSFGDRAELTLILPVLGAPGDVVPEMRDAAMMLLADGLQAIALSDHLDGNYLDALWRTVLSPDEVSEALRAVLNNGRRLPEIDPRISLDELMREATRLFQQGCGAAIRNDFKLIGAQIQARAALDDWAMKNPPKVWPPTQSISSISPTVGCAGTQVSIISATAAFGANQPDEVQVRFARRGGGCTVASVVGWSPGSVDAVAPIDVGVGPVGFISVPRPPDSLTAAGSLGDAVGTAQGDIDACLGASGAIFVERLSKLNTPSRFLGLPCPTSVNGGVNWFVGGLPIIRVFTVNGATAAAVSPGANITLAWQIDNADTVEIVAIRDPSGDRNQLPGHQGGANPANGSWTTPPIACDWAWNATYELRAKNRCGTEAANVPVKGVPAVPVFLWGVALAAGQYEATLNNDWQVFTTDANSVEHMTWLATQGEPPAVISPIPPGEALRHQNVTVAAQEVGRAKTMRLNAYRLSLEWSRLEPTRGNFARNVMDDLYVPLLRTIRAAGMEPVVTLHHLTNPLWVLTPPHERVAWGLPPSMLEDARFLASLRGWENPDTINAFVVFVRWVVNYLETRMGADAPRWWITLNEPVGSIVGAGYGAGIWPPGFTGAGWKARQAYENLLKAHVRARQAIRALLPTAMVGVAQNVPVSMPRPGGVAGDNQAAATQTEYFYVWHSFDAWHKGTYDADFERRPGSRTNVMPVGAFFGIPATEWQPSMDFAGINYYRSWWVYKDPNLQTIAAMGYSGGRPAQSLNVTTEETAHLNDLAWRVDPGALLSVLRRVRDEYGLPVLITENGMADSGDCQRPSYTMAHADILRRAAAEGVDIRGYLHWSVTDNWEWHMSYQPEARFGLYRVDRDQQDSVGRLTLPRRPTESALAMACLAAGLPSSEGIRRFGSFVDDGSSYVVPDQSACRVWQGTSPDGTTWTLLLADLTGGRMLGWLRDSITLRWIALDELSGSLATSVAGAHRRGWSVPERELDLTSSGDDITGSITTIGFVSQPIRLTRDPFVGTWLGGPWAVIITAFGPWEKSGSGESTNPVQPAAPHIGRWLLPVHPRLDGQWSGVTSQPGGAHGVIELNLGGLVRATVTAGAMTMTGTLAPLLPFPLPTPFVIPPGIVSWTRAPDGLG